MSSAVNVVNVVIDVVVIAICIIKLMAGECLVPWSIALLAWLVVLYYGLGGRRGD